MDTLGLATIVAIKNKICMTIVIIFYCVILHHGVCLCVFKVKDLFICARYIHVCVFIHISGHYDITNKGPYIVLYNHKYN